MEYKLTPDGERRLATYVEGIGKILGHKKRRASFACYVMGLIGDGERKSVEPMAARACPEPTTADAAHQRLLHFVTDAAWSDLDVRRAAALHAISAMTEAGPIETWILDDTGFLKQGTHSVGVQRQYTGSAGKITNCQIAVSLSVASKSDHIPIDFDLYLPESWTNDPQRREEARIPDDVVFKTKTELGLDLIRRAAEAGVPRGVLLADSAYGDSFLLRSTVRELGMHYAVGISRDLTMWRVDKAGFRRGGRIAAHELATKVSRREIRRIRWREGTKEVLSARFAMRRVIPCGSDGSPPNEREEIWFVVEWEDGKSDPKYYFSSLPRTTTKKRLVRILKSRWRTERVYEDLKGELGLDHFEGRRFRGWHHHVSVVLCCYAFIASEKLRSFSPSARATDEAGPLTVAA